MECANTHTYTHTHTHTHTHVTNLMVYPTTGNGPSGICLSLLLSGYWPYFNGKHPDEVLRRKLDEHPELSVVEQVRQLASCGFPLNLEVTCFDFLLFPALSLWRILGALIAMHACTSMCSSVL